MLQAKRTGLTQGQAPLDSDCQAYKQRPAGSKMVQLQCKRGHDCTSAPQGEQLCRLINLRLGWSEKLAEQLQQCLTSQRWTCPRHPHPQVAASTSDTGLSAHWAHFLESLHAPSLAHPFNKPQPCMFTLQRWATPKIDWAAAAKPECL